VILAADPKFCALNQGGTSERPYDLSLILTTREIRIILAIV